MKLPPPPQRWREEQIERRCGLLLQCSGVEASASSSARGTTRGLPKLYGRHPGLLGASLFFAGAATTRLLRPRSPSSLNAAADLASRGCARAPPPQPRPAWVPASSASGPRRCAGGLCPHRRLLAAVRDRRGTLCGWVRRTCGWGGARRAAVAEGGYFLLGIQCGTHPQMLRL